MTELQCECIGGPLDGEVLPYREIVRRHFGNGRYFYLLSLPNDIPENGVIDSTQVKQIMEWIPE